MRAPIVERRGFTYFKNSSKDASTPSFAIGMGRLQWWAVMLLMGAAGTEERGNPTDPPNRHPQAGAPRQVNIDPRPGPSLA